MHGDAKPFLVLVMFVLLIVIFAGGAMGQSDLTPSTIVIPGEKKAVTIPDTPKASQNIIADTSLKPASSPCGDSYTVKSGDTLSSIARACNLSVTGILAINPSITNANLIRVGQKLALYLPPAPTATVAAAAPQQAVAAHAVTSTPQVKGLIPGGSVDVQISGLRPKRNVIVTIGRQGEPGSPAGEGVTDDKGNLNLDITIPKSAKRDEQWLVIVKDKDDPNLRLVSQMLIIE